MIIAGVYVFFILEVLLHAWNSHSGHDVRTHVHVHNHIRIITMTTAKL